MFKLPDRFKAKAATKSISEVVRTPWLFFGVAGMVIIGTVVFHTLPKMRELDDVKNKIAQNLLQIENAEDQSRLKEAERDSIHQELELYEEKYQPRIEKVLPDEEGIGDLTRFMERFALQLEKTGPIILSTISYGSSKQEAEYSTLPIRLSFQANNVNFVKFMQMVKKSGSLEEKDFYEGDPIRLMQVDRINVSIPSFESGKPSSEQLYSINLQLSAFFRNPETK